MKTKYIAMIMASTLLTVGLIPLGSAEPAARSAPEGIEVITVVGKHAMPEGIEVITVVGNRPTQDILYGAAPRPIPDGIDVVTVVATRPAPTVASTCVNDVIAARVTANRDRTGFNAQMSETLHAARATVRQAIKDCIEQAQTHS